MGCIYNPQSMIVTDPLFPKPRRFFKWSRHRDATVDHPAYRHIFICQRPLDSVVLIGEIKYRRVRTSKFFNEAYLPVLTRYSCLL